MGWKRIGNHAYFYRSRRAGGRVVSEYVGRGELGALCAHFDHLDRQERARQRAGGKAEREAAGREEQAIRVWFATVEAVAAGAMLSAGFHKHHGQWRRERVAKSVDTAGSKPPATSGATPPAKLTWEEFHGLVKRAEKGDRECLPRLREALKSADYPDWSRWFREAYGNPAEWLARPIHDVLYVDRIPWGGATGIEVQPPDEPTLGGDRRGKGQAGWQAGGKG